MGPNLITLFPAIDRSYVRLYIMLLVVLLVVVTGSNPLVAAAITHLSSLLKSWMWA